jgi:hypothetical protein
MLGATNRNKRQPGLGAANLSLEYGMLHDAGPQKIHLNIAGKRAREEENGALAQARLLTNARAAVKHHCGSSAKLHPTHDSAKTALLREDALRIGSLSLPSAQVWGA